MRNRIVFACLGLLCLFPLTLQAQPQVLFDAAARDDILDIYRPRIAMAADGSFAIAFEAFVRSEFFERWQVAVQRFSPSGTAVGPVHFFDAESCSTLDIWLSDGMDHAELAFRPDGVLLVLMRHFGEYQFANTGQQSAEATLGVIDTSGQLIDRASAGNCVQQKLIFVGGSRQDRPRFAITPGADVLITADGFFDGSNLRNVAIRILDSSLDEVVEQVIPHDDPASEQAFHMVPDIATNGSLALSTWQECPIIDAQGNAEECDVSAQFVVVNSSGGLEAPEGNLRVNSGDPVGTLNYLPAAAMNAGGNSVVVWADYRTGNTGEIYAQRFNASRQAVGPNVQVSTGQGFIEARPEVEILNDGRFMVAWTDSSTAGFSARARHFNADGTPQGSPFLLNETSGFETGLPALTTNGNVYLYVWSGERNGAPAIFSNNLGKVVTNEPVPEQPSDLLLLEGFPNPFITSATLRYTLPETAPVTLGVYNVLGQQVAHLVNAVQPSGKHQAVFDAEGLPTGLYIVRLQQGSRREHHFLLRAD